MKLFILIIFCCIIQLYLARPDVSHQAFDHEESDEDNEVSKGELDTIQDEETDEESKSVIEIGPIDSEEDEDRSKKSKKKSKELEKKKKSRKHESAELEESENDLRDKSKDDNDEEGSRESDLEAEIQIDKENKISKKSSKKSKKHKSKDKDEDINFEENNSEEQLSVEDQSKGEDDGNEEDSEFDQEENSETDDEEDLVHSKDPKKYRSESPISGKDTEISSKEIEGIIINKPSDSQESNPASLEISDGKDVNGKTRELVIPKGPFPSKISPCSPRNRTCNDCGRYNIENNNYQGSFKVNIIVYEDKGNQTVGAGCG